jgi:hypothetical protein
MEAGTGDARKPTDTLQDAAEDGESADAASDQGAEAAGDSQAGSVPTDAAADVVDAGLYHCFTPADFGSALIFDGSTARELLSPSTGAEEDLAWYPFFKTATSTATGVFAGLGPTLTMDLRVNVPPFGAVLAPMTIDLATQVLPTCGACVTTRAILPDSPVVEVYAATGGTLTLTALPPIVPPDTPPSDTWVFSGTLSDVTFKMVSPAAGACTTKIDAASFSVLTVASVATH